MSCVEHEDLWNEALDDRRDGPADPGADLEAHAASCPGCRAASARFQVLAQAMAALEPPGPPAGSTDRLLALMVAAQVAARRRRARLRYAGAVLATAAALLGLAWSGGMGRPDPTAPPAPAQVAADTARPLGSALASARSASIELAREASAPATRIGRDVLGDLDGFARAPGPEADGPPAPGPPDLLQAVGERVNAGVRPISGSARHAFSFLLGPPPETPPSPPTAGGGL